MELTVEQKLQFQANYLSAYLQDVLDFWPVKAVLTFAGTLWAAKWGPAFGHPLLFWVATIWFFDFILGTILAIVEKKWTALGATVGLFRAMAWCMLVIVSHGMTELVGSWFYFVILHGIMFTELGSFLNKIRQLFPESKFTQLILDPLILFTNRRLTQIIESINSQDDGKKKRTTKK